MADYFLHIHLYFFRVGYASDNKNFLSKFAGPATRDFLFLNINILILHYASMQSEIDETNSLKICIVRLEVKNAELKKKFTEIEARNTELKARIAKLEDKQLQNEVVKNLLSVS